VLKRHVDVFFQYLRPFVAALAIIPLLLGIAGLVLDHAQVVQMQIWAIRPAFLLDPNANPTALNTSVTYGSASAASSLVTELVSTDTFLDRVLAQTDSGWAQRSDSDRLAERNLTRRSINVQIEGTQLFAIGYRTDHPAAGVAFLNQLMSTVNQTVAALDLQVATATGGASANQLAAAQTAMNQAVAKLQAFQGQDPTALQQDPAYLTLSAEANAATGRYLSLSAQAQQAELAQSAVAPLERANFQVIDPPTSQPRVLDLKSLAVRGFLLGLIAILAIEAIIVYLVGRRDPRIRSGEEIRLRTGLPYLGSTPELLRAS